jgi:hypothetical protein
MIIRHCNFVVFWQKEFNFFLVIKGERKREENNYEWEYDFKLIVELCCA